MPCRVRFPYAPEGNVVWVSATEKTGTLVVQGSSSLDHEFGSWPVSSASLNCALPQQLGSHVDQFRHWLSPVVTESHRLTNPFRGPAHGKQSRSRATSGGAKPITRVGQSPWRGSSMKPTTQTRQLCLRWRSLIAESRFPRSPGPRVDGLLPSRSRSCCTS